MFRGKISSLLFLLFLCSLYLMSLFSEEVSFIARKDFFVGLRPFSVVVADFNGDENLDLATANFGSNSVSILLGDGKGLFKRMKDIPIVGLNPKEIVVGDFNGDSKPDLAVANSGSNDVSVLLGDGEGGFNQVKANFPVNASPRSIAAGDFNNDGNLDLATANQPNTISVLLGDGNGSFSEVRNFDLGNTGPVCLKVGDFNGDGNLDLVAANERGRRIPILFGDGRGDFDVQSMDLPCEGSFCPRAAHCLVVEDFNGDELFDLAMIERAGSGLESSQQVSVWYGDGKGHFTESESQPLSLRDYSPIFITTADLNNDGILDLVLANQPGQFVSVLLRDGQGGFTFGPKLNFASGFVPNWVAVGDFNGDGNKDLAVANTGTNPGDKTVSIFLGDGEGAFNERRIGPPGLFVVKGDFNNDGNLDLATGGSILLGDGKGGFGEPRRFGTVGGGSAMTVGDFNNDGNLDLATIRSIYLGDGKGNMRYAGDLSVGVRPSYVIAADFNGDGNLDLAVANGGTQSDAERRIRSTISILLGDGHGNFLNRRDFEVGVTPEFILAGDFNNDGIIDLAVANRDWFTPGSISILLGNGDGSFETANEISASRYPFNHFFMAAGDFNKDGNLDLAVSLGRDGTQEIAVLLGDGQGGFSEPRNFEVGITPRAIVAGDFNGDESLDLAVVGLRTNSVSILLGDGQGGFSDQIRFGTGVFPFGMVEGDFNNDGKLDLVTANVRDRLSLLINDTNLSEDKSSEANLISFSNARFQHLAENKSNHVNTNLSENSNTRRFGFIFLLKAKFLRLLAHSFKPENGNSGKN